MHALDAICLFLWSARVVDIARQAARASARGQRPAHTAAEAEVRASASAPPHAPRPRRPHPHARAHNRNCSLATQGAKGRALPPVCSSPRVISLLWGKRQA
jgi:hypothetical protein